MIFPSHSATPVAPPPPFTPWSERGANFYEWFSGLVDGEGSFIIGLVNKGSGCVFKFEIELHIDDLSMLQFIQQRLALGKVSSYGKVARFSIWGQSEMAKLIAFLTEYPLKSSKHLNFLEFKKAFELYTNNKKSPTILKEIDGIKNGMNTLITVYDIPADKKYGITPYWLLGFVEGEGSFFALKKKGVNLSLVFSLTQTTRDFGLMNAIRDFLNSLGKVKGWRNQEGAVSLFIENKDNSPDIIKLCITRIEFILNILVPFFEGLIWQSKKELDFKDWVFIIKLKQRGLHYTENGQEVIKLILSQMNRLSTNFKFLPVDRTLLETKINELLTGPSYFEYLENGKIFIKSLGRFYSDHASVKLILKGEDGVVIETFDSLTACAKFLDTSRIRITRLLEKNEPFTYDYKLVIIKKVDFYSENE